MGQIQVTFSKMAEQFAGAYETASGNNIPDAIHRRYTGDLAFIRAGYPHPKAWAQYEITLISGQLIFRIKYQGAPIEFYRTSSSSPDYGPAFEAAVRNSLAPQIKSEMERAD